MIKQKELEEELNTNTRVFILMIGYGNARLFRDLNKRFERILKKLRKAVNGSVQTAKKERK